MKENKVTILDMPDAEMLSMTVNGEEVFYGNYWDFNWHDSLIHILETAGMDVKIIKGEYED